MPALRIALAAILCLAATTPALAISMDGRAASNGYLALVWDWRYPLEQQQYFREEMTSTDTSGPQSLHVGTSASFASGARLETGARLDYVPSLQGMLEANMESSLKFDSQPPPDDHRHVIEGQYGNSLTISARFGVFHESYWEQLPSETRKRYQAFDLIYVVPDGYADDYLFDMSATVTHEQSAGWKYSDGHTFAQAWVGNVHRTIDGVPVGDNPFNLASPNLRVNSIQWIRLNFSMNNSMFIVEDDSFEESQSLSISDGHLDLWITDAQGQTVSVLDVGTMVSGVPEPTTLSLVAAGLASLLLRRPRRR